MEERHEKQSDSHRRSATVLDGEINGGTGQNSDEKDKKQEIARGPERSKGSGGSSSKKEQTQQTIRKQHSTVAHLPVVMENDTVEDQQSKPNLSKSHSLKFHSSARKPVVQNILKIEGERREVTFPFRTTRSQSLRLERSLERKFLYSIPAKQTEPRKEENVNDHKLKVVEEDKPPFCLDFKPEGYMEYKKRVRKDCNLNNSTTTTTSTFRALPLPKFYQLERDQERAVKLQTEEEEEGNFQQKSSALKPLHLRSSSRGKCLKVPEIRNESKQKSSNISRSKSASARISSRTISNGAKETMKKLLMRGGGGGGGSRLKEDKKKSNCVVSVVSSDEGNVKTTVTV